MVLLTMLSMPSFASLCYAIFQMTSIIVSAVPKRIRGRIRAYCGLVRKCKIEVVNSNAIVLVCCFTCFSSMTVDVGFQLSLLLIEYLTCNFFGIVKIMHRFRCQWRLFQELFFFFRCSIDEVPLDCLVENNTQINLRFIRFDFVAPSVSIFKILFLTWQLVQLALNRTSRNHHKRFFLKMGLYFFSDRHLYFVFSFLS